MYAELSNPGFQDTTRESISSGCFGSQFELLAVLSAHTAMAAVSCALPTLCPLHDSVLLTASVCLARSMSTLTSSRS